MARTAVAQPSTFFIASNGTDQIVHFATALGGIVTGLLRSSKGTM